MCRERLLEKSESSRHDLVKGASFSSSSSTQSTRNDEGPPGRPENQQKKAEVEKKAKEEGEEEALPWFAVSVFGVPDAPTLFSGNPHGMTSEEIQTHIAS